LIQLFVTFFILYEIGEACSACGGGEKRVQGFGGTPQEIDQWGDPGVGGRIILRWIFRKWDLWALTGSSWLRIGTGDGHLLMQ